MSGHARSDDDPFVVHRRLLFTVAYELLGSAEDAEDDDRPRKRGKPAVSSEIGGLNEDRVSQVFEKTMPGLERCLNAGAERIEFLGGSVSFFVKIDARGRLEHAHLERSTIGDRETELCMLETLRTRKWPRPVGGRLQLRRPTQRPSIHALRRERGIGLAHEPGRPHHVGRLGPQGVGRLGGDRCAR